jgi:hypothetical protein
MKSVFSVLAFLPAVVCASSHNWLTIAGDPLRPDADTIQFDPSTVMRSDSNRTMTVRVSRSEQRISGDGIAFRSFVGKVEFDCRHLTARFADSQFFDAPLWRSPGRMVVYPPSDTRPMAFRGFEPNPSERIIHAACSRTRTADAGGSRIVR